MYKGEDLDYNVLSVIMRHLNILKIFFFSNRISGPELFPWNSWDFIDSDNLNVFILKVRGFEMCIRLCNSTPR